VQTSKSTYTSLLIVQCLVLGYLKYEDYSLLNDKCEITLFTVMLISMSTEP